MGLLDSLTYDPQMALGMGLLSAGGNTRMPVTLGQALGSGWGNMQAATKAGADERRTELAYQMQMLQLKQAMEQQAITIPMMRLAASKLAAKYGQPDPNASAQPSGPTPPGLSADSSRMLGGMGINAAPTPDVAPRQAPQSGGDFLGINENQLMGSFLPGQLGKAVVDANAPTDFMRNLALAPDQNTRNMAIQHQLAPIQMGRAGAPAYDAAGNIVSMAPKLPENSIPIIQNGKVVGVRPVPMAQEISAANAAATAGGHEYGKLPFTTDTVNTPGNPTLMTGEQKLRYATGESPPNPGMPSGSNLSATDRAAIQAFNDPSRDRNAPFNMSVVEPSTGRRPLGGALQDQGTNAEQKKYGDIRGEAGGKTITDAASSVMALRQLNQAEDLIKGFTPDKFQPMKQALGEYMIAAKIMSPEEVNKQFGNIGDMKALNAMMVGLAGRLTRQTDANPSQLQFLKLLESMPAGSSTEDQIKKVLRGMRDSHMVSIEKLDQQQKWLDNPAHQGSLDGFENAWTKSSAQLPMYMGDFSVKAPNGKTYNFKSQKDADNFKFSAGIK